MEILIFIQALIISIMLAKNDPPGSIEKLKGVYNRIRTIGSTTEYDRRGTSLPPAKAPNLQEPNIFEITNNNLDERRQELINSINVAKHGIIHENEIAKLELMNDIMQKKIDGDYDKPNFETLLCMAVIEHENGPVSNFTAHTEMIDGDTVTMTIKYDTPSEMMRRKEYPLNL